MTASARLSDRRGRIGAPENSGRAGPTRWLASVAAAGLSLLALEGCSATTAHLNAAGNYTAPLGNSVVTANPTPYSGALVCLAEYARRYGVRAPRVSVWRISDMTGQLDTNGGRPITQGAMLMAITALGKAGVPLVERYETDPSKFEYALANNKLIASGDPSADSSRGGHASPDAHDRDSASDDSHDYEPIYPGQVNGADFFLTGGVTELNTNIETDAANAGAADYPRAASAQLLGGSRDVVNVALDLRLINTKSLDIVDIVSYQKQIIGRQIGIGVYSFFGNNVLTISGSRNQQEPVQLATRSVIERAVFEIVAHLYGMQDTHYCLNPKADPLSADVVEDRAQPVAAAAPPSPELEPR